MKILIFLFFVELFCFLNSQGTSYPDGCWESYPNEDVCIYPLSNEEYYWDVVRECSKRSASVIKIGNAFENGYFSTLLQEIGGRTPFIGVEKMTNGSWVYQDGTTLTYSNWAQGEPSDVAPTLNCAIIDPASLKWKASDCSMARPSFCSMNVRGFTTLIPSIASIPPTSTRAPITTQHPTGSTAPPPQSCGNKYDSIYCNYQGICYWNTTQHNNHYCVCYGNMASSESCLTSVCTPPGQSIVQDLNYWDDGSYITSPGWNYQLSQHGLGYQPNQICEWQLKTIDGKVFKLNNAAQLPFQNMAPNSRLTINNGDYQYSWNSTITLNELNQAFQNCRQPITRLTFTSGTIDQERPFWFDVNLLMLPPQ